MTKTSLTSAAVILAGLSATALAGELANNTTTPVNTVANDAIQTPVENPFSGHVAIGYMSKHVSRGLVMADSSTDNVIPIDLAGQYKFSGTDFSIVGELRYDWMLENGFEHSRGGNALCDEGTLRLGLRKQWEKLGLDTVLGYQFVHGGIPGILNTRINGKRDRVIFDHNQPEEHSIFFDISYDFSQVGLDGLFWDNRIQATFKWMSGWWFTSTLGYKYEWTPNVASILSVTWNATSSYFDATSINTNGTQGVSLNLDVPCKVTENVTVMPFVSAIWAGNGAITAGKRAGHPVYRNFAVSAGVGVAYTF